MQCFCIYIYLKRKFIGTIFSSQNSIDSEAVLWQIVVLSNELEVNLYGLL